MRYLARILSHASALWVLERPISRSSQISMFGGFEIMHTSFFLSGRVTPARPGMALG